MANPRQGPKPHAYLALVAAAEAPFHRTRKGDYLCDPDIAAEYAVEAVSNYLATIGKPAIHVRGIVVGLTVHAMRHARGTAPKMSGKRWHKKKSVRPAQLAVLRALSGLGIMNPPTNWASLDVLIRRLLASGYQPVRGLLTVLSVMRS